MNTTTSCEKDNFYLSELTDSFIDTQQMYMYKKERKKNAATRQNRRKYAKLYIPKTDTYVYMISYRYHIYTVEVYTDVVYA